MTFVVHCLGDWIENEIGRGITRKGSWIKEYSDLSEMDTRDRSEFEWMMDIGEVCIQCGNTVWQIRA